MEAYPNLVHRFVYRNFFIKDEVKPDLESSLLLWLVDKLTIERYDETKRGGQLRDDKSRERLFLNFVYMCLTRAQQTIMGRWKTDALWYKSDAFEHGDDDDTFADDWVSHKADALAVSPEPVMRGSLTLDAFQAKLDANYPGYSRVFQLLRMGYSIVEIAKASNIERGTLDNVVNHVFKAIHLDGRTCDSQAYRTLLALGDFKPELQNKRLDKRQQPLITVKCNNCGKEFSMLGSVYKGRISSSTNGGKLCCSVTCSRTLRRAMNTSKRINPHDSPRGSTSEDKTMQRALQTRTRHKPA